MANADSHNFTKTICSICYEDLKPTSEDLQSISICGHVFHELCLQQWFEYSARTKKYTCPVCKQNCKQKDAGRLYFQSVGDAADATQRPISKCEEDPQVLRREVKRLEVAELGIRLAFDLQGKELKELKEELCQCKEVAQKEVVLKNEALKQQAYMQLQLTMKTEALDKSTMERLRLQERNMALAKELAAFKLVSDLDLDEDEVSKLSTLGNGANTKDTIDILRKSLEMSKRNYKELINKYNGLAREARESKKLEQEAKEKIKKMKTRVQEMETVVEVKDNEVLRALKASKTTRGEGIMQNGERCNTNSVSVNNSSEVQRKHPYAPIRKLDRIEKWENDLLCHRKTENSNFTDHMDLCCTKDGTSTTVHDKVRDAYSLGDKGASKLSTAKRGLSNPKLKEPTYEDVVNQKCTRLRSDAVSDTRKETPTCNNTARTPAANVVILDDVEQYQPMFNIRKESPVPQPLPGTGDVCFSGGLLGPDGTNRFLGKWCKRGLNKGSESRQNPSADSGNLIAVGADGRGGRIKVLRSLNHSTVDNKENAPGTKRFKSGSKANSVQSQGCLQIEHFFGRVGR
ncbi:hypothetical protein ACFX15_000687 [Malus domestica]